MERTLDIADLLLREAEELAARDGTTLLALVEQGLRVVVAEPRKPRSDKPYRLVIKPFHGNGLQPGIKSLHWDEIGPSSMTKRIDFVIAVDTNILVYAHRRDSPQHLLAAEKLAVLSEEPWAIPWPCIHEFFSVITSNRLLRPPTPVRDAVSQIQTLFNGPTLRLLSETDRHWDELRRLVESGRVTGRLIHDAKIAAICLQHGVRELWSADRDFSRFPQLKTINPLI